MFLSGPLFVFKNSVNAHSFIYFSDGYIFFIFHLIHTIFRNLIIHVSLKLVHLLVTATSQYLYWNTLVLFDLMEVK